jgi:hypothetical protein
MSGPDMQCANQGEKTPGRVVINLDPARQQFPQAIRALIVQTATPHIDGFDLSR